MNESEAELVAAAQVLAGRVVLARVTDALRPVGIVPLLLKGALLSRLEDDAPPRPMHDVDVLIRPGEREAAERALLRGGLRQRARTRIATTFRHPDDALDLDLHVALAEPGLFALDEPAILARARRDPSRFGTDLLIPDAPDLYAHLVAHFVRGRCRPTDTRRLGDFARVARAGRLDAAVVAARLVEHGLARAARHVLPLVEQDPFARRVLDALPSDPVGHVVAKATRAWIGRHAEADPAAVLVPHALNRSLARGARSLVAHALDAAAVRVRGRPLRDVGLEPGS